MGDFEQMLNDLCKMSKAQLVQMVKNTDEVEIALNIFKNVMKEDYARVVHCKDCRLRGREECAMFYRCECGEQHTWETDNDFCSYGKQREE